MRCPYCVSEIDDQALACPRCARDLYLFKPLLAKIGELEKTVAEQAKTEERIAALEQELAAIKAGGVQALPAEVAAEVQAELADPSAAAAAATPPGYTAGVARSLV